METATQSKYQYSMNDSYGSALGSRRKQSMQYRKEAEKELLR